MVMLKEYLKDGCLYRVMDDPTELVSNQTGPVSDTWKEVGKGFTTWQDVISACRKPDMEMVKWIDNMVAKMEGLEIKEPTSIKRHIRYREDSGDEVCLDRLRGGQEYWRSSEKERSYGQQTKRIFIDMAVPAEVPTQDCQWRAVAGIVLTHILEKAGYQVELWAVSHCLKAYANGEGHLIAVKLKELGGSLDIDSLSTFTSGWCYRSIWFANKKRKDASFYKQRLGVPTYIDDSMFEEATGVPFNKEDDVYLYRLFNEWESAYKVKQVLGHYEEKEPEPYVPPSPPKYEPPKEKTVETFAQRSARLKAEAKDAKLWAAYVAKAKKENIET